MGQKLTAPKLGTRLSQEQLELIFDGHPEYVWQAYAEVAKTVHEQPVPENEKEKEKVA